MVSGKRASWTKRTKRRILVWLAGTLGPLVFRAVGRSWKLKVVDQPDEESVEKLVFASWHENIPAGAYMFRDRGVTAMTSTHHDGEVITRIVEGLGYRSARGSTTRGGATAMLSMLRDAQAQGALLFTPDGPRGPAHSVAPGVVYLASASGRELVAVGFASSRRWRTRSWDRMIIPKPFSRVVAVFGPPLSVDRAAVLDENALEESKAAVSACLAEARERAEQELQSWMES